MASSFSVNIEGFEELKKKLSDAPDKLQKYLNAEIQDGAQAIANEAKQRAPSDQGILRNLIGAHKINVQAPDVAWEVSSLADYSAFLEFGTRENVQIPEGMEEFASQFKGDFAAGTLSEAVVSLLTAKEAIFAWCKRKGIDEKLWYPIYVSIMVHGIKPRPYFFPAAAHQKPIIMARLEKAVSDSI